MFIPYQELMAGERRRNGMGSPKSLETYYGRGIGDAASSARASAQAEWRQTQSQVEKLIPSIEEKLKQLHAAEIRFSQFAQTLESEFGSYGYEIRALSGEAKGYSQELKTMVSNIETEYEPLLSMYRGFNDFNGPDHHPRKPQGASWTSWVPPLFAVVDQRALSTMRKAAEIENQYSAIESKAIQIKQAADAVARARTEISQAADRAAAVQQAAAQEAAERESQMAAERQARADAEMQRQRDVDIRALELQSQEADRRIALEEYRAQLEAERYSQEIARADAQAARQEQMDNIRQLLELSQTEQGAAVAEAVGLLPEGYTFAPAEGQAQEQQVIYVDAYGNPVQQQGYQQQAQGYAQQAQGYFMPSTPYPGGELFGYGMGAYENFSDAELRQSANADAGLENSLRISGQSAAADGAAMERQRKRAELNRRAANTGPPLSSQIAQLIRAATGQAPLAPPSAPSGGIGGTVAVVAGIGIGAFVLSKLLK